MRLKSGEYLALNQMYEGFEFDLDQTRRIIKCKLILGKNIPPSFWAENKSAWQMGMLRCPSTDSLPDTNWGKPPYNYGGGYHPDESTDLNKKEWLMVIPVKYLHPTFNDWGEVSL